jgi:hypothetical protein
MRKNRNDATSTAQRKQAYAAPIACWPPPLGTPALSPGNELRDTLAALLFCDTARALLPPATLFPLARDGDDGRLLLLLLGGVLPGTCCGGCSVVMSNQLYTLLLVL